ncbi:MAG: hypothetical protein IT259_00965, partial [Saprospiraceae bacterium]|nr:hypothetical protein [Saprospiraceae bacterium]
MRMLKTTLNCWKVATLLPVFLVALVAQVSAQTTVVINSAAGDVLIPDGGYNGTFASMAQKTVTVTAAEVPAGKIITNIRVIVNANHDQLSGSGCSASSGASGWVGDLTMKMTTPSGVFGLMSRPGLAEASDGALTCCGFSGDYLVSSPDLTFDDAAATTAENMGSNGLDLSIFAYSPAKGSIVSPFTTFASLAGSFAASENT